MNLPQSRALTKASASNLALAFILLPRAKRDAMSALYAFCRAVDDVADEDAVPAEKRREHSPSGARTSAAPAPGSSRRWCSTRNSRPSSNNSI